MQKRKLKLANIVGIMVFAFALVLNIQTSLDGGVTLFKSGVAQTTDGSDGTGSDGSEGSGTGTSQTYKGSVVQEGTESGTSTTTLDDGTTRTCDYSYDFVKTTCWGTGSMECSFETTTDNYQESNCTTT